MSGTKYAVMKQVVLAAALAVAGSHAALADDGGMGRFSDSYAYFNNNVTTDKSPSAWRRANPSGISERQLQAYSGVSGVWDLNRPTFASAPSDSSFKLTHPNGLTERELQALSSEASAWHPFSPASKSLVSGGPTDVAQDASKETLASRLAKLFHLAN